jgi:hypothetical protein
MGEQTCNPLLAKVDTGGSQLASSLGKISEILSQKQARKKEKNIVNNNNSNNYNKTPNKTNNKPSQHGGACCPSYPEGRGKRICLRSDWHC